MQELKIISRNSPLAMAQANFVKEKINVLYPEFKIKIIGITTIGDKILDKLRYLQSFMCQHISYVHWFRRIVYSI